MLHIIQKVKVLNKRNCTIRRKVKLPQFLAQSFSKKDSTQSWVTFELINFGLTFFTTFCFESSLLVKLNWTIFELIIRSDKLYSVNEDYKLYSWYRKFILLWKIFWKISLNKLSTNYNMSIIYNNVFTLFQIK